MKKKYGLSMVILVITIIVMAIISAVAISAFKANGIMDKAKETKFKKDIMFYQDELLIINGADNIIIKNEETDKINAETFEEICTILPKFKKEYVGIVKIENNKIVMGELLEGAILTDEQKQYKEWLKEIFEGKGIEFDVDDDI